MIKATGIRTGGARGALPDMTGAGMSEQSTASSNLGAAAAMESERINANKAIKQENISGNVAMGATIGGIAGSFVPGVGTMIGAAAGALIGRML